MQDPLIGTTLDNHYEILALIRTEDTSVVYKAKHKLMKRIVAIKMLKPSLVSDPESMRRFQDEAKESSALADPDAAGVHDFGVTSEGTPYMVISYSEETGLADPREKTSAPPASGSTSDMRLAQAEGTRKVLSPLAVLLTLPAVLLLCALAWYGCTDRGRLEWQKIYLQFQELTLPPATREANELVARLMTVYEQLGEMKAAISCCKKLIQASDSPDVASQERQATLYAHLAMLHCKERDSTQADEALQKAEETARQALANLRNKKADLPDRILKLYIPLVTTQETIIGQDNPRLCYSYWQIGAASRNAGNMQRAREYDERARQLAEKYPGQTASSLPWILSELYWVARQQNRYDEAERFVRRTINFWEAQGDDKTALSYLSLELVALGDLYTLAGKFASAEQSYKKAMIAGERSDPSKSHWYSYAAFMLAQTLANSGRHAPALPYYKEALDFYRTRNIQPPAQWLSRYAFSLRAAGHGEEAQDMEAQAKSRK